MWAISATIDMSNSGNARQNVSNLGKFLSKIGIFSSCTTKNSNSGIRSRRKRRLSRVCHPLQQRMIGEKFLTESRIPFQGLRQKTNKKTKGQVLFPNIRHLLTTTSFSFPFFSPLLPLLLSVLCPSLTSFVSDPHPTSSRLLIILNPDPEGLFPFLRCTVQCTRGWSNHLNVTRPGHFLWAEEDNWVMLWDRRRRGREQRRFRDKSVSLPMDMNMDFEASFNNKTREMQMWRCAWMLVLDSLFSHLPKVHSCLLY